MARRLIPASEVPRAAATVAEWLVAEWEHLYPQWTHQTAVKELLATGQQGQPPVTWLLFDGDPASAQVIGSVGLALDGELEPGRHGDATTNPSGTWVVNLFVSPKCRGRGHGTALLSHAVNQASARGLSELLLTTEHSAAHYSTKGWHTIGSTALNGHPSTIMTLTLATTSFVTP